MLTERTDNLHHGKTELTQELKNHWGGKGAGLISMSSLGFPVPEALVISTEEWKIWRETGHLTSVTEGRIKDFLKDYPDAMFSVRSGAPISMPGMMETVLNVGSSPELNGTHPGAFERFCDGWLRIVCDVPPALAERAKETAKRRAGDDPVRYANCLSLLTRYSKHAVPVDREEQVLRCVEAVFRSWNTERAVAYRKMHGISDDMGTACVVQRMVMGNAPGFSGTGVMFSRDPATGENAVRGEIAFNAQGEDVVSGAVTPENLQDLAHSGDPQKEDLHCKLEALSGKLEATYKDVQDVEFTVEDGQLYVLQTRTAKMSATARVITACDLSHVAHPSSYHAARFEYVSQRVDVSTVLRTRQTYVNTCSPTICEGLPASPGAVTGRVVYRTTPLDEIDKGCVLVAHDTAPEDFPRMAAAGAILTSVGGFTCHSAVVARGIGVPAVVGAGFDIDALPVDENDVITVCGQTGKAWSGAQEVVTADVPAQFRSLIQNEADRRFPGGYYVDDEMLAGSACAGVIVEHNPLRPLPPFDQFKIVVSPSGLHLEDDINHTPDVVLASAPTDYPTITLAQILGNP